MTTKCPAYMKKVPIFNFISFFCVSIENKTHETQLVCFLNCSLNKDNLFIPQTLCFEVSQLFQENLLLVQATFFMFDMSLWISSRDENNVGSSSSLTVRQRGKAFTLY